MILDTVPSTAGFDIGRDAAWKVSVVVGEHMGVQNSSIMGSGVDECVSRHC